MMSLALTFFHFFMGQTHASVAHPGTPNKHEVSVCFANVQDLMWSRFEKFTLHPTRVRAFKGFEQRWIQENVEKEFSKDRTVAHMTGWTSCDENPKADVYIFGGEEPTHLIKAKRWKRKLLKAYNPNLYIYVNLNHDAYDAPTESQIGHLVRSFALSLGLADEALRAEAKTDPKCSNLPEAVKLPDPVKPKFFRLFARYDSESVTHTCNLNPTKLSKSDIHTLKCLYSKFDPEFKKENCHVDFDPAEESK